MQGLGRIVGTSLCATVLLAACSGSAATTTSTPPPTAPPTTTITVAETTTTTPATTLSPTTNLPDGTVGDPAALRTLAEQVASDSLIPIEDFYIPDITQADPIEALKELLAYSDWMGQTFPDKELTKIHTLERSPARTAEENFVDSLETFGRVVVPFAPYVSDRFEMVGLDEVPTTEATRSSMPEGSVAIRFLSTSEGYAVVDEATGEVVEQVDPWEDLVFYVVIAPTEYGWQEYWYTTA